jgi:spore maturation protein CgeB
MYLNFEYPNSKLFKKKKNEIRIGWTGSAAHWENLKHIEEPITQILKKYPQATFYYTGIFGDLFQDKSIAKQIKKVPFAKLKEWAKFNREVNFDIAVAPLMDNIFNRAKSNLRILEYASAKFPVICSPIKPYQEFKDHREILFAMEKNEWFDAIEELILNPDLRKELADNLHKTAKDKYDIDKNYKIWVKALKEIKDRFDKAHKQS